MRTPQIVPTWLKLKYPISKYAQDAQRGYWWDITASGLTAKERALAVSLRWRWHALMNQSENFAELIPNYLIRKQTIKQIRNTKRNRNRK